MTLRKIGQHYGTDKQDSYHSFKGRCYLDVYASYLDTIRNQVNCVLEIGVLKGASLRMWRDYFPNAQIWGLDIDPKAELTENRIHFVLGNQTDPSTIAQIAPGQEFDLIVDDGSHLIEHMLSSHKLLWPRLKPGGLYVIEDLRCTYEDVGQWAHRFPGYNLLDPNTNLKNHRKQFNQWFLEILAEADLCQGDVEHVHFWPMLVFLRKSL